MLSSLAAVDLVILFDEDTPIDLIEAVRPQVLVKGADYRPDEVVGGSFVESYGGRVLLADLGRRPVDQQHDRACRASARMTPDPR